MRPLLWIWSLAAVPAYADQLCSTATIASAHTSWNQVATVSRFDPALGTLNSITISITTTLTGSFGVESPDAAPTQVTSTIAAQLTLRRPDNSDITSVMPGQSFVDNLTAFDGVIDFGGTSGVTHTGISVTAGSGVPGSASDLPLFSGPAGNPGSIDLQVIAQSTSFTVGAGAIITSFNQQSDAVVVVCYDFTPAGSAFCFGDGTGTTPCPCSNSSAPGAGQGCLNSTGVGARLDASGTPSVSNDSLVLTCSGLPANAPMLFFQGTSRLNLGNGVVFGDGLRCPGGVIVRIRQVVATGGTAVYPSPGDAPVSAAGAVPANSMRHYQAWYRNAAAFCTSATFNLSQGLTVSWSP